MDVVHWGEIVKQSLFAKIKMDETYMN